MYCGESAQSAGTAHSQGLELAAAPAPARRTSNDSEIRPGYRNRPEGFPAVTGPPHMAAALCVDLSTQPASLDRSAECRVRDEQFPRSVGSFRSSSTSPILLL